MDASSLDNWISSSSNNALSVLVASSRGVRAHNLPHWSLIGNPFEKDETQNLTAHPSTQIRQDLQANLIRSLQNGFLRLLHSSEARAELRSWLLAQEPEGSGPRKLDRWSDEQKTIELTNQLRAQCHAVSGKYLAYSSVYYSFILHVSGWLKRFHSSPCHMLIAPFFQNCQICITMPNRTHSYLRLPKIFTT